MIRKKLVLVFLGFLMIIIIAFTGCTSQTTGDTNTNNAQQTTNNASDKGTVKFSIATYNPLEAGQTQVLLEFIEDIERLTDKRVTFELFPGSMLLGAGEMYDGVVEGITDIGFSNLAYTFGRFPVTELLDTPIGFPNAWVANHVASDFYKEFTPEEFSDVHMLTLHTSAVNNIITIDKAIRKPDDLKGLTLRGTGYIAALVEEMGAASQALPMPEAYDYLAKNVIDGLMIPYETVKTYKYQEVVKNVTEVWPLGQVYTFYLAMNKNSWDKLPPQDQEIITKYIEEEFVEKLAQMWNGIEVDGKHFAIDQGFEIYEIPSNELPLWQEKADNVLQKYINSMVGKGYSKEELQNNIDFVHDRIDYWTEKQIELGIKSATGPPDVLEKY